MLRLCEKVALAKPKPHGIFRYEHVLEVVRGFHSSKPLGEQRMENKTADFRLVP